MSGKPHAPAVLPLGNEPPCLGTKWSVVIFLIASASSVTVILLITKGITFFWSMQQVKPSPWQTCDTLRRLRQCRNCSSYTRSTALKSYTKYWQSGLRISEVFVSLSVKFQETSKLQRTISSQSCPFRWLLIILSFDAIESHLLDSGLKKPHINLQYQGKRGAL